MWAVETIAEVRQLRAGLPGRVGLVPTMGALHAGHVSLIEATRRQADHVVVSVFVNPTQFGPHEDFHRYPRPLERDLALCREAGSAGVFHPSVAEMYPPGRPACEVHVPAVAGPLEGERRPGHFAGVCRVVAKLLHIVQPEVAAFGLKDYQQLRVIAAMVEDLDMPVAIAAVPTVREADGLAMSSRNAYLDAPARRKAVGLFLALSEARRRVEAGEADPAAVEAAMRSVMEAHGVDVDYAAVRHGRTLAELARLSQAGAGEGAVALVAGRVGGVRLIDNFELAGG